MKINIPDVSIIIPLRVDSPERMTNVTTIVSYLRRHTNAPIFILEADAIQKGTDLNRFDIRYRYIKDETPVFHHTRYRNEMIKTCTTPFVAVWDVDVITPMNQIQSAVEKIRSKEVLISWPYDGICYHVPKEIGRKFETAGDMETLTSCNKDFHPMFGGFTNGGIFFADREQYMAIGMENEHICGWGPEDIERLRRMTILGLPVHRVRGELYHLWHPRGIYDPERDLISFREYLKVCGCTREELLNYIKTWEWTVK